MTDKVVDEFAQHLADGQAGALYDDPLQPNALGRVKSGNIDLKTLPVVYNPDGGWGTVKASSFDMGDGKETVVPTILHGQPAPLDDKKANAAAVAEYRKTGRNLGVFNDVPTANAYAQTLHSNWEAGKIPGLQMNDKRRLGIPPAQWAPPLDPPPHIDMQTIPSSAAYRARAAKPVQPLKRRVYGQ